VAFALDMPEATSVAVAGTFNNWSPDQTPMRRERSGKWKAVVFLPSGRHEYRFVVDGRWISDPAASETVGNSYGSTNSVLAVQE